MTSHPIEIALRIPGTWVSQQQFAQSISSDCKISGNSLVLADGFQLEIFFRPRDGQFVEVFRNSCRTEMTAQESEGLRNYRYQVCLAGPGGSMESASAMMRSALPILDAGGTGVFIDNSALSFGGSMWRKMAGVSDTDSVTFGFVNVIRSKQETFTVGMQTIGQPDISLPTTGSGAEDLVLIDLIFKVATEGQTFDQGHSIELPDGQSFKVQKIPDFKVPSGSPIHNPWGRLELKSDQKMKFLDRSRILRNSFRKGLQF
jgi:hypothetical protein